MVSLVAVLLGPTLFWAAYHYYHDRHRPEPLHNLLLCYALGLVAALASLHAYVALDIVGLRYDAYALAENNRAGLLVYCILVIGVVEELAKFLPFWLIGMRQHAFDEPIDGIIYASFIALGFASYENIFYLPYMTGTNGLARAIASPAVHIAFASVWGYLCGRAALVGRSGLLAAATGLGIAAVLHGIYDFFVIGYSGWVTIAPPVIILVLWVWRLFLLRRLQLHLPDYRAD